MQLLEEEITAALFEGGKVLDRPIAEDVEDPGNVDKISYKCL